MKKFDLKEVLVPTISLFLICTVVTLLLAVTNSVTQPQIEKLQIETANKTIATNCLLITIFFAPFFVAVFLFLLLLAIGFFFC